MTEQEMRFWTEQFSAEAERWCSGTPGWKDYVREDRAGTYAAFADETLAEYRKRAGGEK